MPELVDLPPELIELIFIHVQGGTFAELRYTGPEARMPAPLFRLTNRYIEQCTRREFVATYFDDRRIRISDDASIKRFCAMARTPDLAKCLDHLVLVIDNDTVVQAQDENVAPTADAEPWEENITYGILGPPAYVRSRNEIVTALRACSGINALMFRNAPQIQDSNTSSGVGAALPPSQAETMGPIFDVSFPFRYILSLAEEAGVCLAWLSTAQDFPEPAESTESEIMYGLSDCSALAEAEDVLCCLEALCLHLVPVRMGPRVAFQDV
jgi:hypothetical protein